MKTTRSEFAAHQAMTARAQSTLIERAEWSRMLDKRDAKREARRYLTREQPVPRNGAQWGVISYAGSLVLAVCGAACMLFGRFI